jgi:predicted MFS family arabinose efflux permease
MRGVRIYLATPRLRGLLALNLSFAAAGATVIVNTVVIVRGLLDRSDTDVAIALGRFGGGSMVAALLLPRILDRLQDRRVMLPAAAFLAGVLFVLLSSCVRLDRHRRREHCALARIQEHALG